MTDASASPKGPSLVALLWAMVKRMAILMATPGADRSIAGLWAEIETVMVRMLLQHAEAITPGGLGLDPAQFDIRLVWTKSGMLDFRITPKGLAALWAHRERLLELRRGFFMIEAVARAARRRGANRFNRYCQAVILSERRRAIRRRRSPSHRRAGAPDRVSPLILVPP